MVAFLGFYAAAELSHFVEIVPRVPVSAVKWKKFGKMGFRILRSIYRPTTGARTINDSCSNNISLKGVENKFCRSFRPSSGLRVSSYVVTCYVMV